jgi:hypothetical protein
MRGYIYCLSNEHLKDDIFKIGFTKRNPIIRLNELYNTSIPTEFKLEICKKVSDCVKIESVIHTLLNKFRINPKREFFKIQINKISMIFDLIEGEYVTIEDLENIEKENEIVTIENNDESDSESEDEHVYYHRKTYVCEHCSKIFGKKSHLVNHMNRKYKCLNLSKNN